MSDKKFICRHGLNVELVTCVDCLQQENERLRKRVLQLEDEEGPLLPEGTSFKQYASGLQAQIADLTAKLEAYYEREHWLCEKCNNVWPFDATVNKLGVLPKCPKDDTYLIPKWAHEQKQLTARLEAALEEIESLGEMCKCGHYGSEHIRYEDGHVTCECDCTGFVAKPDRIRELEAKLEAAERTTSKAEVKAILRKRIRKAISEWEKSGDFAWTTWEQDKNKLVRFLMKEPEVKHGKY